MNCSTHPDRASTVTCHGCSKPFCDACVVRFEKLFLCAACKSKFLVDVDSSPRPAPRAPAAATPAARPDARAPAASLPREARRGGVLPWVGGAVALLFSVVFLFVMAGSLAKQYRDWSAEKRLASAFAHVSEVGAALERYHFDSGKYPDDLKLLVPKYLKEIPGDPFGGELHYAIDAESGRRVWSVGPDEKDDHGAPPADIAMLVAESASS